MENQVIKNAIAWHDDKALEELLWIIIMTEVLTPENLEFLDMLEDEIEKRKSKVSFILNK